MNNTEYFKTLLLEQKRVLEERAKTRPKNDDDYTNLLVWLQIQHIYEKQIRKIEAALKRIECDTFGICPSCEGQVEIKKLIINPQGLKCIHCQKRDNGI